MSEVVMSSEMLDKKAFPKKNDAKNTRGDKTEKHKKHLELLQEDDCEMTMPVALAAYLQQLLALICFRMHMLPACTVVE